MQIVDSNSGKYLDLAEQWSAEMSAILLPKYAFINEVEDLLEGRIKGEHFFLDNRIEFRPGELTVWAGASGSGKSLLTGQVAQSFVMQADTASAILSLEMSPARTLMRMFRQACGRNAKTDRLREWVRWGGDRIMLLNHIGSMKPLLVMGATIAAAKDHYCKHVFIDNLMKIVDGEDDYSAQKDFVRNLCALANSLNIHIHLVCHTRKTGSEADDEDKYSVRGSQAITDQADNVIIVKRNLKKVKMIEEGSDGTMDFDEKNPDGYVSLRKQRNGDAQNIRIPVWFDTKTGCFCATSQRIPVPLTASFLRNK